MTDYKVFETPVIKCLPCQESVSHTKAVKMDDGTTCLEVYCPKVSRVAHIYYADGHITNQSFIEGIIRLALSLCVRCKELQHPYNCVEDVVKAADDICHKTESKYGCYWSSSHS